MTEVERVVRERIAAVENEKAQVVVNYQRCEGALQVLRYMLGEALREQDAVLARSNGVLPVPGTGDVDETDEIG